MSADTSDHILTKHFIDVEPRLHFIQPRANVYIQYVNNKCPLCSSHVLTDPCGNYCHRAEAEAFWGPEGRSSLDVPGALISPGRWSGPSLDVPGALVSPGGWSDPGLSTLHAWPQRAAALPSDHQHSGEH